MSRITTYVAASGDDAFQVSTGSYIVTDSASIWLGCYTDPGCIPYNSGFRFVLDIKQGTKIKSAVVNLWQYDTNVKSPTIEISADASDDAVDFTVQNVASRTTTTAKVYWSLTTPGVVGALLTTDDISQVIQEIVNRPGWSAGNHIALLFKDKSTPPPYQSANFQVYAYDSGTNYAELVVTTQSGHVYRSLLGVGI